MDRFVVPPRDDAKRRREVSPRRVGDRGSGPAMTAKGRWCAVKKESDNNGHRVWERQRPTGLGGEARPPSGEAPARDG